MKNAKTEKKQGDTKTKTKTKSATKKTKSATKKTKSATKKTKSATKNANPTLVLNYRKWRGKSYWNGVYWQYETAWRRLGSR